MEKIAIGKVRELLIGIGEIQDLVGRAQGYAMDDRNRNALEIELDCLKRAFNKCVEMHSEYKPID